MKLAFQHSLTIVFLFSSASLGQQFYAIPPDTCFPVELQNTVRASRAKVGDPVEFRTLQAILIGHGIVIPENSQVLGEVAFVRSHSADSPSSWVRIWVRGVRWKSGQASINAVVDTIYYVRSAYIDSAHRGPRSTFLEGISISPHLFRNASTDFYSDEKEVVLRSGILLQLRHVVPPEVGTDTLAATSASSK